MDNHHWLMCLFFGLTWCLVGLLVWYVNTLYDTAMDCLRNVQSMVYTTKYEVLPEMRQCLPASKCGRLWLLDGKDKVCAKNHGHAGACSGVPDAV